MIIRRYREEDFEEAKRLCVEFTDMIKALLPAELATFEANIDGGIDIWIRSAAKPGFGFFVAETEPGRLAGFIQGRTEDQPGSKLKRWGIIEALYVSKEHRQSGIGSRLCKALEDWFKEKECDAARVDTWITNTPAIEAYTAMGFVPFYTGFVKEIPSS